MFSNLHNHSNNQYQPQVDACVRPIFWFELYKSWDEEDLGIWDNQI